MSEIEPGLFIGGVREAANGQWLESERISHVLTVDIFDVRELPCAVTYKFIQAIDNDTFDLLQHFPECCKFIEQCLQNGGRILVHCQWGISRSVTIVTAYLMQKHKESSTDALQRISEKRPQACPNPGFLKQLQLYKRLNFQLEKANPLYRQYKLLCTGRSHVLRNRGSALEVDAEADAGNSGTGLPEVVYKCRSCRTMVLSSSSIVYHVPTENTNCFNTSCASATQADKRRNEEAEFKTFCEHGIFLLPLKWMEGKLEDSEGKLFCPKCSAKLGSYNWSGQRCACSAFIVPWFQIQACKVDRCVMDAFRKKDTIDDTMISALKISDCL